MISLFLQRRKLTCRTCFFGWIHNTSHGLSQQNSSPGKFWLGSTSYWSPASLIMMRVISVSVSVKGSNSKKKSTCSAGDQIQSLGREDPLENGMTIHSSILAWRIPWTEEPGGLQSMGLQRIGHYWATFTVFHFLSERLLQLTRKSIMYRITPLCCTNMPLSITLQDVNIHDRLVLYVTLFNLYQGNYPTKKAFAQHDCSSCF